MTIEHDFFTDPSERKKVYFEELGKPDDWVEIKRLSIGDREKLEANISVLEHSVPKNRAERRRARRTGGDGGDGDDRAVKQRISDQRFALLCELAITAWSLKDAKGQAIPLTRESFSQLSPPVADWLADRINEVNPTEWEESHQN